MDSRIILFTSIWCSYLEMRNTNIDKTFCEDIRKLYNKWLDVNHDIEGFDEVHLSMQIYIDTLFKYME